jgi:hypothetical protein
MPAFVSIFCGSSTFTFFYCGGSLQRLLMRATGYRYCLLPVAATTVDSVWTGLDCGTLPIYHVTCLPSALPATAPCLLYLLPPPPPHRRPAAAMPPPLPTPRCTTCARLRAFFTALHHWFVLLLAARRDTCAACCAAACRLLPRLCSSGGRLLARVPLLYLYLQRLPARSTLRAARSAWHCAGAVDMPYGTRTFILPVPYPGLPPGFYLPLCLSGRSSSLVYAFGAHGGWRAMPSPAQTVDSATCRLAATYRTYYLLARGPSCWFGRDGGSGATCYPHLRTTVAAYSHHGPPHALQAFGNITFRLPALPPLRYRCVTPPHIFVIVHCATRCTVRLPHLPVPPCHLPACT